MTMGVLLCSALTMFVVMAAVAMLHWVPAANSPQVGPERAKQNVEPKGVVQANGPT